jgi:NADPH2:quinone reductase
MDAKGFRVGDRVVTVVPSGSHAERVAATAATTWLVPTGADLLCAACAPVAFGTAHEALFALGDLAPGDRVTRQPRR